MNDRFSWTRVIVVSIIAVAPMYFLSAIALLIVAGNLDVAYALGISDTAANAIPVMAGSLLSGAIVARMGGVRGWWIAVVALCGLVAGLATFLAFVAMDFDPGQGAGIASWGGTAIAIISSTWFAHHRTHSDTQAPRPQVPQPA